MYMTIRARFRDMLPALLVFALVAAFTTYVTVAYIARDPWWLQTLAELRSAEETPSGPGQSQPAPARTSST